MTLEELAELQQQPAGPDMTEPQQRKLSDDEVDRMFEREMRRSIRDLERDYHPRYF